MSTEKLCGVCQKPAIQNCSACNAVYYCSKDHQKLHWKKHKLICAPYKIAINGSLQSLLASRDIKKGDLILVKSALLSCPENKEKFCLNCYKTIEIELHYKCAKCKWPMCNRNCEISINHIKDCKFFAKVDILSFGEPNSVEQFVTLTKILICDQENNKSLQTLKNLTPKPNNHTNFSENVVKNVKRLFTADEAEIAKLFSIFQRYSITVHTGKIFRNTRAFYPVLPIISQNCKSNSKICFSARDDTSDYQLSIIATVPIKKGHEITVNYCNPFHGTLERQIYLKTVKNLDCSCQRCSDPTEFDTYTASIYCTKCKEELMVENGPKMISSNSLNPNAFWQCEKCLNKIAGKQIASGNQILTKEVADLVDKKEIKNLEQFLFKYGEILHSLNMHVLNVKYSLVQIYGNCKEFELTDLPDKLLERKIQLCQELLDIADILDPGQSRLRGHILYELQEAMVIQTKRNFCKNLITKNKAEEEMRYAIDLLSESWKILLVEMDFKETLENKVKCLKDELSE